MRAGHERMFSKILIANRGEIACRIIRTAQQMGIRTVAVFSEADKRALHVEMADEAVPIGPALSTQSYLSIDRIIEACRRSGAEAVHPGYGFLSERAAFPRALAASGIAFIGPNAKAVEAMGDKIESKKFAAKAKVTTVPGHLGIVATAKEAAKIADSVGYPVMIKASAGGGGKGMRIVHKQAELVEGFERARAEAASAFGDDRVFIEKYIENPRHIEVQILADKQGNVVHLGERECSIQRRNQKIIEEAPSPLLDEKTRRAMAEQAIALAKAVNYNSAGTVEFVAGQDKSFYFLEMNTRIQVEHPVTELVTGIDIVEQMIRIAAGESLSIKQSSVKLKGWAVECRVYAENPYRNFLPSTGRLVRYRPPKEGPSGTSVLRCDTGVYEGAEIPVFYDPLVAKLVVHAADRATAVKEMSSALESFVIAGIEHNIPFLSAIMENKRWKAGRLSTGFVTDEYPDGFKGTPLNDTLRDRLVCIAAHLDCIENARKRRVSGQMTGKPVVFSPHRVINLDGEWFAVEVLAVAEGQIRLGLRPPFGRERLIESNWVPFEPVWRGKIDGELITAQVTRRLNGYGLQHAGVALGSQVYSEREASLAKLMPERVPPDRGRKLLCPMPGLVVSILVKEGQDVKSGEAVAIVEAMKMQNVLRAERDGTVKSLLAVAGDSLAVDSVIMEFD